tara:strand:- start:12699 stop:12884 length:186 start_codon:yes stop_codon:yes gene_type:complete
MKLAPNRIAQKKIKDLAYPAQGKGLSVKEISERLQIKEKAVKAWVDHFNPDKKEETKKETK